MTPSENGYYKIRQVTVIGAAVNILLAIAKIIIGYLFGSIAVVTDGLHSLSDLFTDIAVIVGVRLSERQPDIKHPYGHTWYESFTTIFIAVLLAATGAAAIYSSLTKEASIDKGIGEIVLILTASSSILLKEILYKFTVKVAKQTNSSALYANAWHHRSDSLSSLAVLAGLLAYSFGYDNGDKIASIIVGALIITAAVKLLTSVFKDFTNAAVDAQIIQAIEKIIEANPEIGQMHKLRSRSVGREVFLDFHILVNPEMNVRNAHKISTEIETQIAEAMNMPVNIIVHIEPDEPAHRK